MLRMADQIVHSHLNPKHLLIGESMERAVKVMAFITCMITFLCAGIYAGMWLTTGKPEQWKCIKHEAKVVESSDTRQKELIFICTVKQLVR